MSTSKPSSSEDIVGQKLSTCNLALNNEPAGRTWPIALSTGFGAGAAYADCDRSFNPARIPGTRIISQTELEKTAAPSSS
ncbi:hypothetical protein PC9H_000503 [Pleurotus ostreatus]|uniref:MICOS complex subunit MIC10 n=1 Tax=Pleurotus ostreatus TaxID=5322 RepID=A0A8H7A4B1_PLEOS|nr:uncharacterized protein PC9H_000503 [Pleurotus ostreatus]KAF7440159.1 hypothetical protein PC9H_000503 [Pleurotus ostreatus]